MANKNVKLLIHLNQYNGMRKGIICLFILLFLFGFASAMVVEPRSIISNALYMVHNGGSITTQAFVVGNGEIVNSNQFAEMGFDPKSVIFYRQGNLEKLIETGHTDEFSYFSSKSTASVKLAAQIVCSANATALETDIASLEFVEDIKPTDFCVAGEPCCAVILKRGEGYVSGYADQPNNTNLLQILMLGIAAVIIVLIIVAKFLKSSKLLAGVYYASSAPLVVFDIALFVYTISSQAFSYSPGLYLQGLFLLELPIILVVLSLILKYKVSKPKWEKSLIVFTAVNAVFYFILALAILTPIYTYF